ncbi:MAG: DUF4421 domain-containing protein [Bacteroidetes bacterium]|nr:DUF4421 domain-containing protein [Bacteroidota bacterium]
MKKSGILCLLFLLVGSRAQAFDLLARKPDNRDTSFIAIHRLPINFRLYGVTKFMELNLRGQEDSIPSARYNPHEKIGIGIGSYYRSIGFFLGLHTFGKSKNKDQYRLDLQLNQFGKKFSNDFYLQRYQGLYLENTDVFKRYLNSLPGSYRNDVITNCYGANTNYYFNWKKFSIRAAFIQSEHQKKDAGSWSIGGGYSGVSFRADSSLIPLDEKSAITIGVKAGKASLIGLNGGYSYIWVWKKYAYASISLSGGTGIAYWRYTNENNTHFQGIHPLLRMAARASVGYNANKYFFGLNAIFDQFTILDNSNTPSYSLGNIRAFIGYRIGRQ